MKRNVILLSCVMVSTLIASLYADQLTPLKPGHACIILPSLPVETAGKLAECILVAKVLEANEPQAQKRIARLHQRLNMHDSCDADEFKELVAHLQFLFGRKTLELWQTAYLWLLNSKQMILTKLTRYGMSESVLNFMEEDHEQCCEDCRQCVMQHYLDAKAQGRGLGLAALAAGAEQADGDTLHDDSVEVVVTGIEK